MSSQTPHSPTSQTHADTTRINQLLAQWRAGDQDAYNGLMECLHVDLQRIAHRQFRRERGNHTMQTNDLVGKLYLKMLGSKTIPWESRLHFLNAAARTMRQILIDHARSWQRRADGPGRVPLEDEELKDIDPNEHFAHMISLHQSLERLEAQDQELARMANLKLVVGMSLDEIAAEMNISLSKAKRRWIIARKFIGKVVWGVEEKLDAPHK